MQEPSHSCKFLLLSTWYALCWLENDSSSIQSFSHFEISSKYQHSKFDCNTHMLIFWYHYWCSNINHPNTNCEYQNCNIIHILIENERIFVYLSYHSCQYHSKPYWYHDNFVHVWRLLHGIQTQMILKTKILSNTHILLVSKICEILCTCTWRA